MKNELPIAGDIEKEAYLQGFRKIVVIEGDSMFPTLKSGVCVVFNPKIKPEIGDIILFYHPFIDNLKVVKRISEITAEGNFIVRGDNPQESTDSRSYGAILQKNVLGVAVCRLK